MPAPGSVPLIISPVGADEATRTGGGQAGGWPRPFAEVELAHTCARRDPSGAKETEGGAVRG